MYVPVCGCGNVLQPPHSLLSCNPQQCFHFPVITSIDFPSPCACVGVCLYTGSHVGMCMCCVFLISVCVSLQVELTGSSVFDYIHPADHVEMAERLGISPHLRAEAGCHTVPESASSSASTSSLAGTPEPSRETYEL